MNTARVGGGASGFGGVISVVLGFAGLLFLEPYYNSFIKSGSAMIGVSPFNPTVPLILMVIAAALFIWPIYQFASRKKQELLVGISKKLVGLTMLAMSIPLFIFSFIHWAFYSSW